jgi:uncharacterized protein YukE
MNGIDLDFKKVLQDQKILSDSVKGEAKKEFDDLFKQIQKVANKVSQDMDEQGKRVAKFEEVNLKSD